ncbi:MAG: creatininase family protein [Candidatus Helarchaeota archaeon]
MSEGKEKEVEYVIWVEFQRLSEKIKTVIIPWGAIEAHGTHLPLSTDSIFVTHISKIIAKEINALILPTLPIGYCFHASSFPGTISLTKKTVERMAFEIAKSLRSHGIKNLIFISGHGGNIEPLEKSAQKIKKKLKIMVEVICPFYLDESQIEKFNEIKTSESIYDIYHAEELETSLILAISPHLVKMNEAKVEYPSVPVEYLGYSKRLGDLTRYCVFGDPTAANKEKGDQFLEIMVENILRQLRQDLF